MEEPNEGRSGSLWAGRPPASNRRLEGWKLAAARLLAPLASFLLKALCRTWRLRVLDLDPESRKLIEGDTPMVPCFWHGTLTLVIGYLLFRAKIGSSPCFLISPSADGDAVTQIASRWEAHVVRGSATRTGGKAIRDLYRAIARERCSPLVLADGPVGPVFVAKPGAVMLAQLAQVPILPIGAATRAAVRLTSWDRLTIPLPFARVSIVVGPPITIPRDFAPTELERATERLTAELNTLQERARVELSARSN